MFRVLPELLLIAAAVTFAVGTGVRAQEDEGRILFVRGAVDGFREGIWTVAPDGSGEAPIDVGVDFLYMAEVSADGTQIVFGGAANLHTVNIDGLNVTKLPFNIQEHSATWSPDGTQLVFTDIGPEGWTWDLYIANLDGSGRRLLVDSTGTADFPDWSPDGTKIAFTMNTSAVNEPQSRFEIFTINADGSGLTQLTSDGSSWFPDWSPDGARIAFASYRDGYSAIYTMNADGSDQRAMIAEHHCEQSPTPAPTPPATPTQCPGDEWPDWSPDGTRIAFHTQGAGGDIWYANADGSGLTQVTSGPESDFYPQWFTTGSAPATTPQTASPVPPSPSATPCVSAAPTPLASTASPLQPKSRPPVPTATEDSQGTPMMATPDPTPAAASPAGPTASTPSPMSLPPPTEARIDVPAPVTLPTSSPPDSLTPTPTCPPEEVDEEKDEGGIAPEATIAAAAALGTLVVGPPLLGAGALAWKARRRSRAGQ